MLQEGEQRTRDVFLDDDLFDEPASLVEFDVEGRQAEDREPHDAEDGRQTQHAQDEPTDGAALGDPGDEDSDER